MNHPLFFCMALLVLISCNPSVQKNAADSNKEKAMKALEDKDFPSAKEAAEAALELYAAIPDTLGIIESNYILARASALTDDFENALRYGEPAKALCMLVENYSLENKINNILSWSYFTLGKSFEETLEHQNRHLMVVEQLNDDMAKASVYNNYGYDATVSGTIPLSQLIEYMVSANDYYARAEGNKGRWYTLMNLTWQHRLINDLTKSEEYGNLSVQQAKTDNDRHAIIEANTNLAETLLLQNRIKEAKALYESALTLSRQKKDRDKYVFDVYYAKYLWETEKKEVAISLLKEAIVFLEGSEIFYEMQARALLAEYSFLSGDLEAAKQQIQKFKNPRANYFSQESEVDAAIVEAQILSTTDQSAAIKVLAAQLQKVNKSGAELLKRKLMNQKNQL